VAQLTKEYKSIEAMDNRKRQTSRVSISPKIGTSESYPNIGPGEDGRNSPDNHQKPAKTVDSGEEHPEISPRSGSKMRTRFKDQNEKARAGPTTDFRNRFS
jgi:hypothetical protein